MSRALEGIRIVEWAHYIVGPYACAILADLGVDVVKIEEREAGDPLRTSSLSAKHLMAPGNRSYSFETLNRGVKSIALNVKEEAGKEIVYRLVEKADVFVTNYRQDACVRLGMDYSTLSQRNPQIVYVHATGFGKRGPDAENPAFDHVGQARAGQLLSGVRSEMGPFTRGGQGDIMGSITTSYAILAGLMAKERLGIGQEIDTSIMGSMMWLMTSQLNQCLFSGEEPPPYDLKKPRNALNNCYMTKDSKWIATAGTVVDKWWGFLCQALGIEEYEKDPRFLTTQLRGDNSEQLVPVLERAFARFNQAELLEKFKEADYPAAPANTPLEAINDPQAIANEYVVSYDHPFFGPVRIPGFPIHFGKTPAEPRHRAPDHGEHTDEVLLTWAGYSPQEVEALRVQKVIK